jgi:hypothetical protein
MKPFLILALAVLALGASSAAAQSTSSRNKTLSNQDIIEMSQAGVPQSTIIASIQSTPVKFDVSPEAIVALHTAGVAEPVLHEMIRANAHQNRGPSFGVATASFPVQDAVGKTVHYSAWIKTENVLNGYAGLWWRVDGEERVKSWPSITP